MKLSILAFFSQLILTINLLATNLDLMPQTNELIGSEDRVCVLKPDSCKVCKKIEDAKKRKDCMRALEENYFKYAEDYSAEQAAKETFTYFAFMSNALILTAYPLYCSLTLPFPSGTLLFSASNI